MELHVCVGSVLQVRGGVQALHKSKCPTKCKLAANQVPEVETSGIKLTVPLNSGDVPVC